MKLDNKEQVFTAGDLVIDPKRQQVSINDTVLNLPELSYQLLLSLVKRWPETVTQQELLDTVWQDIKVQPATLGQRVKLLRQSLKQAGYDPQAIVLVRGKGYRFGVDVKTENTEHEAQVLAPSKKGSFSRAALFGVLIALFAISSFYWISHQSPAYQTSKAEQSVVAFSELTLGENQPEHSQYVVTGFNRELINLFEELNGIRVLSIGAGKQQKTNPSLLEQSMNVNAGYLLSGSLSAKGSSFLVSLQLQSSETGKQLWAGSYHAQASELYHLKYEIGAHLQSVILPGKPQQFVLKASPNMLNPSAYDLYLQAMNYYERNNYQGLNYALELLAEANDLSPSCAAVSAGYAEVLHKSIELGVIDKTQLTLAKQLSSRIAASYPELPLGYELLATNAQLSNSQSEARELFNKALLLDHHHTASLIGLAKGYLYTEQLSEAILVIDKLRALEPNSPTTLLLSGELLHQQGQLSQAEALFSSVLRLEPDNTDVLIAMSRLSLTKNDKAQAQLHLSKLSELAPNAAITNALANQLAEH